MSLIDSVLQRPELRARPPVLLDIGASGKPPARWRRLAPYAVCVAFDADERDFDARAAHHPYRTLHLHPHIVTDRAEPEVDFHLTRSPYCSSTLEPARAALSRWIFADLFDVERKVRLPARRLQDVLAEHGLAYVDWFKTDSQGTDLRLFLFTIGTESVNKTAVPAGLLGPQLKITDDQASARFVSTNAQNGSVLELWNLTRGEGESPPEPTLGAVNFGDAPGYFFGRVTRDPRSGDQR